MFMVAKGLLKKDVPADGGSLETITGSAGAAKIPLQILNFTQNVTGNISIPSGNTYGYLVAEMGAYNITGDSAACFTNDNTLDLIINGSGTIDSAADKDIDTSGSGSSTDISSSGLDIAETTGTTFYTGYSTYVTQSNSGHVGSQSGGSWNVIRENVSGTGCSINGVIVSGSVSLSGTIYYKSVKVYKNGTLVLSVAESATSWGSVSFDEGDTFQIYFADGPSVGGTINFLQTWSWSGSGYTIGYTSWTGTPTSTSGGTGATSFKILDLTNNNTRESDVTLNSGTTGISTGTTVAYGASQSLQANSVSSSNSWALNATFAGSQTLGGVLYSGLAAFDGSGVSTDSDGVPSDGIDLTGFTGTYNRVL